MRLACSPSYVSLVATPLCVFPDALARSQTVAPLPEGVEATKDTLYASGTTINDLAEVRELLNTLQRPGISPEVRSMIRLLSSGALSAIWHRH